MDEDRALRGPKMLSSQDEEGDEEGAEEGPSLLESGDCWAILFASSPALETMITLAPVGGQTMPRSPTRLSPSFPPPPTCFDILPDTQPSVSAPSPAPPSPCGLGASRPLLNLGFPSIASRPLWIQGLPFWEWAEHRRVGRAALGRPPGGQRRLCPGPQRRAGQEGLSPPVAMPGCAHRASH